MSKIFIFMVLEKQSKVVLSKNLYHHSVNNKMSGHQHKWLARGYDQETGHC